MLQIPIGLRCFRFDGSGEPSYTSQRDTRYHRSGLRNPPALPIRRLAV
jgi:hypothetical protein